MKKINLASKWLAYLDITPKGLVVVNQLDLFDQALNEKRERRFRACLRSYYSQFNVVV